jgi:uncharacterized membrane protein YdjX (TVP38/TMEM64 family)
VSRTDRTQAHDQPGWLGVLLTVAGIALAALIVLLTPDLRDAVSAAISGDTDKVRSEIDDLGARGALIVFALAMIHAVVLYPSEILNAAAGFAYGFWPGLALVAFSWLISGLVAYAIGHHAGRPLLYRLAGERRIERGERLVERGGVPFLLAARLLPIVPYSLTGYVCGAARVPLWRFTWTSFVGYLPITAVFVYLGTRLETLSFFEVAAVSAAVLVALLLAGRWLAPKLA